MAIQADNVPSAVELQDAVVKKHTAGGDTTLGTQSQNLNMGTNKIVGVVDPTANQDCATKKYVDDNSGGVSTLQQAFDGGQSITIADGDNQTLAIVQNDTTNNPDTVSITNTGTGNSLVVYPNGGNGVGVYVYTGVAHVSAILRSWQAHVDSTGSACSFKTSGVGSAVEIESANALATAPACIVTNAGTGHGLYILQDGALASGKHGLYVYSTASHTGGDGALVKFIGNNTASIEPILEMKQDHVSSTSHVLHASQDGSGACAYLYHHGAVGANSGALYVYTDGANVASNSFSMYIRANNASSTYGVARIHQDHASCSGMGLQVTQDGTGHCIYASQIGVLGASKHAIYVYSNAVQVNSPLVKILQDNASSTANAFEVRNDGTGICARIDNNGTGTGLWLSQDSVLSANQHALYVYGTSAHVNIDTAMVCFRNNGASSNPVCLMHQDHASATGQVLYLSNDGTGHGIHVNQDGVLASGKYGLYVYSNAVQVNSPLAYIKQDNASSTEPALEIQHDGAEGAIEINATHASASHFRLTGDPTNSTPVDGDVWFNGTNMKIRIGATTYNFDVTAE